MRLQLCMELTSDCTVATNEICTTRVSIDHIEVTHHSRGDISHNGGHTSVKVRERWEHIMTGILV